MASGNLKNFELKIGRAGLIIIVVGMTALLCTAFLFGVDVGKNIDSYPQKIAAYPQKILEMVWKPARVRAAQVAQDNKTGQSQPQENIDLTFYDTLTSKKGIAKEQSVPEKQSAVLQPQIEKEKAGGNVNVENQKTGTPVNNKTKETVAPKGNEIEQIIASSKQKFIIQVASLKKENIANQMSKKISSLGFKPEITKIEIKGKGTMFRLNVSGFETKLEAQDAAQKISAKTKTNCIVKSIDNENKKN